MMRDEPSSPLTVCHGSQRIAQKITGNFMEFVCYSNLSQQFYRCYTRRWKYSQRTLSAEQAPISLLLRTEPSCRSGLARFLNRKVRIGPFPITESASLP